PAFAYSGMAYVSDEQVSVMAEIKKPDRATCLSFNKPVDTSKTLLQAILHLKLLSAMEAEEPSAGRATKMIKAIEATLTDITGRSFRFKPTQYPNITLKVVWSGAELSFD